MAEESLHVFQNMNILSKNLNLRGLFDEFGSIRGKKKSGKCPPHEIARTEFFLVVPAPVPRAAASDWPDPG